MIHWIKIHIILISLGIFSCIPRAMSQTGTPLHQVSLRDGLSSDNIVGIFQDSKGFMYFGTNARGLNRFDGLKVKSWVPEPGFEGLDYPYYGWSMVEDRQGCIWIGGGTGLYQYDPKRNLFKVFRPDEPPGTVTCITGIYLDKSDNLWIGGGDLGLLRFDLRTHEFETSEEVFGKKTKCPFKTIILEDSHGDLWFSAPNGLYQASPKKPIVYHPLRPDKEREENDWYVYALCEDDRGNVWVGTQSELLKYDHQKKQLERITLPLIKSGVRAAIKGPQGHLWLASIDREEDGVYVLNPETLDMYNHFVQIGLPEVFKNTDLRSLFFDRSGGLWVGTFDSGVFYWNVYQKPFKTYQTDYDDKRLILFDKNQGQIWSAVDGKLTPFEFNNQQHAPLIQSENFIVAQDKNKSIWMGSWEGLSRFRHEDGHWLQSPKEAIQWPGLKGKAATQVYADNEGILWVGVHLDQLYRYDDGNNLFKPFPLIIPESSDTLQKVSAKVFGDHYGFTWVSVVGRLFKIKGDSMVGGVLNIPFVNDLHIDGDGMLWLATLGGLYKLDPRTYEAKTWLRRDGLPHHILSSILADDRGNLWIGTQNGLSRFNIERNSFRNYNSHDGLPSDEFYSGAMKDSTGNFFFLTSKGLLHFHPDSISDNPYIPDIVITDFQINNSKTPIRGSLGDSLDMPSPLLQDITYTDEIYLQWNQNNVSFEFASLNYLQPEKNQYDYRLLPEYDEWTRTDGQRPYATYTNLNSGTYTFEVRSSNNDEKWNSEAVQLNILISPPWYKTWWAYILYGLSIFSILWMIRRYENSRRLLRYQLDLENVRAEKLQEMNEVKSRFFTNISHEFRTPLTLMLGPVRDLMKNASAAQRPYLELLQRNSHRVLNLINQLLDLSKIENKEMRLEASLQDVVPFIRQVFSAFSSIGKAKGIRSIYHTRAESIFLYFDSYKLEKVLLNILSNAYKFTPKNGEIRMDVEVRSQGSSYDHMASDGRQASNVTSIHTSTDEEDWPVVHTIQAWDDSTPILILSITDSGPGVAKNALPYVFDRFYQTRNPNLYSQEGSGIGLALAKELIHLHHGRITVRSKVGTGTCFSIQIPLGKNHLSSGEIVERVQGPELDITMIGSLIQTQPISNTESGDSTLPLILLVEDNSDMRAYIRLHLQHNYKLIEVENGQQGLDVALQKVPDIVLSDVMMPIMDGLELCQRLKSDHRTSHIPVILLTAKAEIESRIEGLECGADAYLAKPFDKKELMVRIGTLLALRRTLQSRYLQMDTISETLDDLPQKEDHFIRDLQIIIQENLQNPDFGIQQICRSLRMSRAQVYRKVKALTGISVNLYIRKFRIRKGFELLKNQNLNVSEVAYEVGFKDPAYFSRTFRSEYGISPTEHASKYTERNRTL